MGNLPPLIVVGIANTNRARDLTPPVLAGAGASVAGDAAVGPNVVLGPQCVVEGGASLRNAVVLEGAVVPAGFRGDGVIVSAEGILEVPADFPAS
jgi:NDP-sugar pyrophosphorylase family protein